MKKTWIIIIKNLDYYHMSVVASASNAPATGLEVYFAEDFSWTPDRISECVLKISNINIADGCGSQWLFVLVRGAAAAAAAA